MPLGAPRNVRLGDLTHRDGGLHAGVEVVFALQEVLQRKAIHHGAEHAHVVGAGPVHAALVQFGAAEEVAATDDDGDLHAVGGDVGDLVGDGGHHVRVDADLAAAEHLTAEFEHHSSERASWVNVCHANSSPVIGRRSAGAVRTGHLDRTNYQAVPTSNRLKAVTVTPASASSLPTVFFESSTEDCSVSTASL